MKRFFLVSVMCLSIALVQAQTDKKPVKPNEQSKVVKEYDEQGNLIRYDSTFVSSWSSADSLFNAGDLDALQKQLDQLFGGSFFNDSTNWFGSPFQGGFDDPFFSQFGLQPADSTHSQIPGFQNSFPDFEEMHQRMMSQFRNFFQNDSIQFGNDSSYQQFQFFGSPEELERMQQEFEQQREQQDKSTDKKTGT